MKEQNIFRDKLYFHEEPVPPEVWDRIADRLPSNQNDRAFPIFWLFLIATLITGGSIMFWTNNQPGPNQPMPKEGSAEMDKATVYSDQVSNIASEQASAVAQSDDLGTGNSSEDFSDSNSTSLPSGYTENQPTALNIAETGTGIINAISNSVSIQNSKTNTANKKDKAVTSSKKQGNTTVPSARSLTSSLELGNRTLNSPSEINHAAAHEKQPAFVITTSEGDHTFIPNSTSGKFHLNPLENELLLIETAEAEVPVFPPPPADVDCYKFKPQGSPVAFSFDLFGGPGISPKSFHDNGSESPIYQLARKSTEHFQYAWSAGFRVNLHLRNGLAFRTGLLYEQTGDIFDYTDTLATKTSTQIDSFFSADGSFLYADTNRVLVFGTLIKKIHNQYRNLDLPFLLGYEFIASRTVFMIHAGPVLHISNKQKGQILNPSLHPASISSDDPNKLQAFSSSLGVSLYVGGGMLLPLSKRISALVEPRMLLRLKPVTIPEYVVSEKRFHAGLNLGIRYHL